MKHKKMLFILALIFIFPCALLLTSCDSGGGGQNNSSLFIEVEISEGIYLTDINSVSIHENIQMGNGNYTDYAVWLQDGCDKDTLKVYLDGNEVALTEVVDADEYANRLLSSEFRKIATFKLGSKLDGKHKLTCSVDMETVTIKLVDHNQFAHYNEEEKSVLKDWYFEESDGTLSDSLYDLLNDQVNSGAEPYSFDVPFNELDDAIQYACSKPYGYYNNYFFWLAKDDVEQERPIAGMSYINETTDGDIRYSHYSGSPLGREPIIAKDEVVEIYIKSAYSNSDGNAEMKLSELRISNEEDTSGTSVDYAIYQIDKNGDNSRTSAGATTWTAKNENDIKVYFEHREGVDFSNLKVYLYGQEVTLHADGEDRYFVIEKGKLPVDYCSDLTKLFEYYFMIRVEGIEITEGTFPVISATTNIDNEYTNYSYTEVKGYYKDGDTIYCLSGEKATVQYDIVSYKTLSKLVFNDEEIDLSDKISIRDIEGLPVDHEDYDGTENEWVYNTEYSLNYYYRVTTTNGDKLVFKVGIIAAENDENYGKVVDIFVFFKVTKDTNIQLVYALNE